MEWAKPLKLPTERVSYHVLEAMDPASRIVEFAQDNQAAMIMIGASHKVPNKVAPWRTSMTKIVEEAPCSVHIVRTWLFLLLAEFYFFIAFSLTGFFTNIANQFANCASLDHLRRHR